MSACAPIYSACAPIYSTCAPIYSTCIICMVCINIIYIYAAVLVCERTHVRMSNAMYSLML